MREIEEDLDTRRKAGGASSVAMAAAASRKSPRGFV